MKSNLMKILPRTESVMARKSQDQRVTRPSYYPSKPLMNIKKLSKTNSIHLALK